MPRPNRPLADIFVSARSDRLSHPVQAVTPRTPHSRSGRAEEGRTEYELDQVRNDDSHGDEGNPFLSPPRQSSVSFRTSSPRRIVSEGYRSRGDDHDIRAGLNVWQTERRFMQRYLLISGSFVVCGALVMLMMAFKRAGVLDEPAAIGRQSTSIMRIVTEAKTTPSSSLSESDGRLLSYENYTHFPLTGAQYRDECEKISLYLDRSDYWIPSEGGLLDVPHHDDSILGGDGMVCSKTITYMLDGHVGLATDLALMAQVAAFAQERDSTFLVDDTYWNRGNWIDHFENIRMLQLGPEPGCRAPPPNEMVACPRTARHWVVSSSTAKYHFGHQFVETYEAHSVSGFNRQKPIFNRALRSLTDTVHPNAHTLALIHSARSEIASILSLPHVLHAHDHPDPYIGIHISRGDHSARLMTNNESHVPLPDFVRVARDTWSRLYAELPVSPSSSPSGTPPDLTHFPAPPIMYLATDSPEALREFIAAFSPSTAVFALDLSTYPELRALAPERAYAPGEFAKETEEERVRLTRGMIVDLALLSGLWVGEGEVVPGAAICEASSNMCKLAAVGLGWNRAFGFGDGGDDSAGAISQTGRRWVDVQHKRDSVNVEWRGFDEFH